MDKIKFDKGKDRLALVPTASIKAVGAVMTHGVEKYYENSWKEVEAPRWRDALMRHWCEYIDDPYSIDPDSGLPHLWHIAANAAILCGVEDSMVREAMRQQERLDRSKILGGSLLDKGVVYKRDDK